MTRADQQAETDPGESDRYVFLVLPRCPACQSSELKVYGHVPEAEVKSQYVRCKQCAHRFICVWD